MKYKKIKGMPVLEDPATWEELFKIVLKGIDLIVQTVKPTKLLFISLDGVTPVAKQVQSRQKNFYDAKQGHKENA
jgi:5'-3' exonuclease